MTSEVTVGRVKKKKKASHQQVFSANRRKIIWLEARKPLEKEINILMGADGGNRNIWVGDVPEEDSSKECDRSNNKILKVIE